VTLEDARQECTCGFRVVHDQGSLRRHQLSPLFFIFGRRCSGAKV
jgi:hypothetical protein